MSIVSKSRPLTENETHMAHVLIDFLQAAQREGCIQLCDSYARTISELGRKNGKTFSEYDLMKGVAIAYAMGAISGTMTEEYAAKPDSLEEGGEA